MNTKERVGLVGTLVALIAALAVPVSAVNPVDCLEGAAGELPDLDCIQDAIMDAAGGQPADCENHIEVQDTLACWLDGMYSQITEFACETATSGEPCEVLSLLQDVLAVRTRGAAGYAVQFGPGGRIAAVPTSPFTTVVLELDDQDVTLRLRSDSVYVDPGDADDEALGIDLGEDDPVVGSHSCVVELNEADADDHTIFAPTYWEYDDQAGNAEYGLHMYSYYKARQVAGEGWTTQVQLCAEGGAHSTFENVVNWRTWDTGPAICMVGPKDVRRRLTWDGPFGEDDTFFHTGLNFELAAGKGAFKVGAATGRDEPRGKWDRNTRSMNRDTNCDAIASRNTASAWWQHNDPFFSVFKGTFLWTGAHVQGLYEFYTDEGGSDKNELWTAQINPWVKFCGFC